MKTKKETAGKLYEQLTFTDDFMFCKVMTNHPELCKELLELILGIKIRELLCHFYLPAFTVRIEEAVGEATKICLEDSGKILI